MSLALERTRETLQPLRRGRLYWAVHDALVLAWRTLVQTPRMPDQLVFATIQPVMFVLLFRYVFGGAISVEGTSYVNYLMAGIFVQTVAFGAMNPGISITQDMQKGLIERFRSLPMAASAVLTGRTLAELARNAFIVTVMLVVGVMVGFRPEGNVLAWAGAIGLMLLFSFALSWISVFFGLIVNSVEASQSAGFIWLFPFTFVSSAFVPVDSMPGWLEPFAKHQPVSQTIDAVRALLLGQPVGNHAWVAAAWCLLILAVFWPLAVRKYKHKTAR
jgi:ABC-2 type transport system permease protein/oleandomycin transport system permease protein